MKRGMIVLGLSALLASPAAAQWLGMPVWNNPKGGTGITISGDLAKPDSTYGKGTAFGARGSLGLGNLNLTLGLASWKPEGATNSTTSVGGQVGFRVIGGSLIPIAVNLQGNAGKVSCTGCNSITLAGAAVGVSVNLPTPGLNIEPYISPGLRYAKVSGGGNESDFGFALGVNVGLGMLGFHAAYDYQKTKAGGIYTGVAGHLSTIAIGAHVALKAPIGM
ncbi:MAG TPA: hypothetical protein VI139_02715 [Gemmatimonadales bacterium]